MAAQDSLSWVSAVCLLWSIWFAPAVLLGISGLSKSSSSLAPEPKKTGFGQDHRLGYDLIANGWAAELAKAVAGVFDATTDLDFLMKLFGVAHSRSKLAFGKKQCGAPHSTPAIRYHDDNDSLDEPRIFRKKAGRLAAFVERPFGILSNLRTSGRSLLFRWNQNNFDPVWRSECQRAHGRDSPTAAISAASSHSSYPMWGL